MTSQKISILVVEDSEDDQELIALELHMAKINSDLTFIQTAKELKAGLEENKPDIILCDYNLPTFNAFSALEIVKEFEETLPFIIVSGHVSEEDAIQAMKLGASDFVMKDNLSKLSLIIKRELEEVQVRKTKLDAEKSLRKTQAQLEAIINNSPAIFILFDEKGELIQSNKKFQDVFGESKYKAASNAPTKSLNDALVVLREKVLKRRYTIIEELHIPVLDIDYEVSCFLIEEDVFQESYVGVSLIDITQRKREQAQVSQLQKMEALGKLTGGVAHDFNNLLTIIQGNAELLEADLSGFQKKCIDAILRAAGNGNELTRQLLSFARTEAVNVTNSNISELAGDMLTLIGTTLGAGLNIHFNPADETWISFIDTSQFENVLLNMMINSRDAMDGKGDIFITTTNETIDIAPRDAIMPAPPGEYVHISIKDTGTGIPDDVLARVFEPFFTTKEVDKGTGLGLSMIFGFVKQSEGFITVDSEPNVGTTFGLYFPRSQNEDDEVVVQQVKPKEGRVLANILIVEDEEDVLNVIVEALKKIGHTITTACAGEEAIAALDNGNEFDLVVSDVVLAGGMNGQEVMRHAIKNHPKTKNLFISGHTKNLDLSKAELGRDVRILAKPFSMTLLVEEIDSILVEE